MRYGSEHLVSFSTANVDTFSKRSPLKAGQETFHSIIKQHKQATDNKILHAKVAHKAFPSEYITALLKKQVEEVGL